MTMRSRLLSSVIGAALLGSTTTISAQSVCPGPTYIVGNSGALGNGPIMTYDFAVPGDPRQSFVPEGASGSNNGRGLEVIGDEVFYTELTGPYGVGPTDFIRVVGLSGGDDIRLLPNPTPERGIAALSFHDGQLYALTGYPSLALQVFTVRPTDGTLMSTPVGIRGTADASATGFTVLPSGRFLINDSEESCIFNEYDPVSGAELVGTTLHVPAPAGGFEAACSGVDTDGTFLYFQTNGNGFTRTDLTGAFVSRTSATSNNLEDISLRHACSLPDTTAPFTTATTVPAPTASNWNNTNVTVSLTSVDPAGSSAEPASGISSIVYFATGAETIPQATTASPTATVSITREGTTTVVFHAADIAGNVEADRASTVNIDRTPPVITFTGTLNYTVDQTITIGCTASDPLSGILWDTCASAVLDRVPAYTMTLGPSILRASAGDRAGNTGSGSATCVVTVTTSSLCALQTQFVHGSATYINLTAAQKKVLDGTVAQLCQTLGRIVPGLTATQRANLIATYKKGLDALVQSGWLTASQQAILVNVASAV